MADLVVYHGSQRVCHTLNDGETVIGRHPECAIRLDSRMISGRHARVVKAGEEFFLEDLDSRNGTFLNGRPINGRMSLTPADHIQLAYNISARLELGDTADSFVASEVEESTIKGELQHEERFGRLGIRTETKLKAVLAITSSVAGTIDLRSLLPKILDTLFRIFPQADRGCILLKDERTGEMVSRAVKLRSEHAPDAFRLSRTILQKVLNEKTGILSENVAADSQFDACESIVGQSIWSMMCVPMLGLDGTPIGIISIDSQTRAGQFTQEDLDLLMIVAGQVGLSYENARLLENYLEEQRQSLNLRRQTDELKQYFSPKVVDALTVSDIEETLKPQVVDVTVLFCDIRGFSLRGGRLLEFLDVGRQVGDRASASDNWFVNHAHTSCGAASCSFSRAAPFTASAPAAA